jgi:NAD(P)-dependent dehydrogenase (short-subunit alcohol dehydrogenase family)
MAPNGTSSNRLLVVFGTGPGIGNAVTSLFVTKRYSKVALLARGEKNLQQSKEFIEAAARNANTTVDIKTWAVDLADVKAVTPILSEIEQFGELETVFYNAARVRGGPFFEETEEDIRYDFEVSINESSQQKFKYLPKQICITTLYAIARWAIPKLQSLASSPDAIPSFFVTNSLLYQYPEPTYFTLSLTKAAQRTLVQCLAATYQKDGVHIGLISVGGPVSDEDPVLNKTNIAKKTWEFFTQKKEEWGLEVEILPETPYIVR